MSYRRYPPKLPRLGWLWLIIVLLVGVLVYRIFTDY